MPAIAAALVHHACAEPAQLPDFELRRLEVPEFPSLQVHAGEPVLIVFSEPDCNWC